MKTEHQRSAGGLVIDGDRILLISTRNGRRWQLPKGHIERGETPEQAAVREVREETGVDGRIIATLPPIEYWYVERGNARIHKKVDYYLLTYLSGSNTNYDPEEVSGAEWLTWEDGLARLSFDNERQVVRTAREIVRSRAQFPQGPSPSTTSAASGGTVA